MKKIVVIGAGGLAREVKWLIDDINQEENQYEFLGYIVSSKQNLKETDSKELVIGDFSWFENNKNEDINVVIGIGNPRQRLDVSKKICDKNHVVFPTLIHPSVIYDKESCKFGRGVVICAGNILTVNVHIDDFTLVNLSCSIGHETKIGKGCVINPLSKISGGVLVKNGVLVGTGVSILQYKTIGSFTTLGAASCITKSIPENVVAVGVPAKIINS